MKMKIVLMFAIFAALASSAQTNSIMFPQLLSATNSVLMTNAEFRCYSGDKMFFKNEDGYKSFHAADLSTNVLNALGTSAEKLEAQQKALEGAQENYRKQVVAAQLAAYRARQFQQSQALSAERERLQSFQYSATHGRTGWDGREYHDNQSEGNFIGN